MAWLVCMLAVELSELRDVEGDNTLFLSDEELGEEVWLLVSDLDAPKSKLRGSEKADEPLVRGLVQLSRSIEHGEAGAEPPAFSRSARRHACEQ